MRRNREDKDRGRARRKRRLGEEREVAFEVEEEEHRVAMSRCRAMLTAARREAWRAVRWMSAR